MIRFLSWRRDLHLASCCWIASHLAEGVRCSLQCLSKYFRCFLTPIVHVRQAGSIGGSLLGHLPTWAQVAFSGAQHSGQHLSLLACCLCSNRKRTLASMCTGEGKCATLRLEVLQLLA